MKWLAIKLVLILAIGAAVYFLLPVFGTTSPVGIQTKGLSNAKQLATGAKLYAMDHDGRFPVHLSELEPDYLPVGGLNQLLYRPSEGMAKGTIYPVRCDWLYFGAFHDEKNPPTILIASPQAFTENRKSARIVVYSDTSAVIVDDENFQTKIRQTIKELNERATSLMPKQENTTRPIADPGVPR
jgi:hypothetical protein